MKLTKDKYIEILEILEIGYNRESKSFKNSFKKVKQALSIDSVVLQSEQLLCIKCKEAPANRGLGEHKLVCSDCWNSLCD